MNALIEIVLNSIGNRFTAMFVDTAVKSFVVLTLAGGVCFCARRVSAATRHFIWFLAVASLPCLPLLSSILPTWPSPLWSVSAGLAAGNQIALTFELTPNSRAGSTLPEMEASAARTKAFSDGSVQGVKRQRLATHFDRTWLFCALCVWCLGASLVLSFFAAGKLRVRVIGRRATASEDPDWRALLQQLREELRLRRDVTLLKAPGSVMPATWGGWRPQILLPSEADSWSAERRRVVLLHELAHVKRWDCLTQTITEMVCALCWFNPLVWFAARRMCIERERACDDFVLDDGCKASDYADHLVAIARAFRRVPRMAAIAMARSSNLEKRIAALVDASRRRGSRWLTLAAVLVMIGGIIVCVGGCQTQETGAMRISRHESKLLRKQIARLQAFSVAKEKQARTFADNAGEQLIPEFQPFFDAATKGDWQTVTNMYADFKRRHAQYHPSTAEIPHSSYWSPMLEVSLAYFDVVSGEPKYIQLAVDKIINSIPAGSIYFGGTDPGRGLITAFCKSHVDADPFFTLTQNALADATYLQYLRSTYVGQIYLPTSEDSQKAFNDYVTDAARRLQHDMAFPNEPKQIKPGEGVTYTAEGGRVQVSGQIAVMSINALLVKVIFDKNPEREFYIEESFPLDWMYPHLSPHGLVMKLNRQPLSELSEEIIQRDREFWRERVDSMIGNWLAEDTPVTTVTEFAQKVYVRRDLNRFKGDPRFVQNNYPQRMFSKWRSAMAGVYAWRRDHANRESEKGRMAREADFAYRQALVLCPDSPEVVFRYANLLQGQNRLSDAILVAEMAAGMPSLQGDNGVAVRELVKQLRQSEKAK